MNTEPLSRIADGELQERIERFGRLMCEADVRFKKSGAIEDRVERDQASVAQKQALQERARRHSLA